MFRSARIKLTTWYLLIIMFISISFSAVVYSVLTHEVERFARAQRFRIEHGTEPIPPRGLSNVDPDLVREVKIRIYTSLALINLGILLFSGISGYFLAGRTLKPISDMVDEQNRFVTDASHEFRTPLTALKSSMEVFLRDHKATISDARKLIIGSINDVDNLNLLSNSLLQLAQYQKPNGNINFETVSLSEIIENSMDKVKSLAKIKKVSIKYNPINIKIEGNKYSLNDLFVLLLENAIKYSHEKGEVLVSAKRINDAVKIQVSDKGVGISEKDLPHIFDRFYRADEARTQSNTSGYGLGLAIAKSIVNIHHGTIMAESKLHKGTTLTITLPVHFS